MGSIGVGNFSDYSGRKPKNPTDKSGGASGEDNCGKAFQTSLEDIGRCFYYINYSTVPAKGTDVNISFNGLRIVAETKLGEEIGYLPTRYNYLRYCIEDGLEYSGIITFSTSSTPSVTIDVTPI